jgi:lipopolysaccharide export system protein LptA
VLLRRLAMALGVFVVLLAGVTVYQHLAGDRLLDDDSTTRDSLLPEPPAPSAGDVDIPYGKDFRVRRTDDEGRVTGIYEADQWRKLSAKSILLTRPRIRLNQRDGQRIYIQADSGIIYADESSGAFHPRSGILEGHVRVLVDRWRHRDHRGTSRPALEERSQDIVRIFTDDIEFDNEALTLHTDGKMTLFSAEADLAGRGLTIQWHEDPSELRIFRLEQGEYLVIYAEADEVFSGSDSSTPKVDEVTSRSDTSTPEAQALSAKPPTPDPVAPRELSSSSGPARSALTVPPPMALVPAPPQPTAPQARNVYEALLKENVRVYSGERSMRNADSLSLRFEWDRNARRDRVVAAPATRPPEAPSAPEPRVLAPLLAQASPPFLFLAQAALLGDDEVPSDAPSSAPASAPKPPSPPAEPIMIYWDGPLTISPVDTVEEPNSKRYEIEARGKRVVWSTPDVAAVCTQCLLTQNPPKDESSQARAEVRLIGSAESPVRLAVSRGDHIVCREVQFGRESEQAKLFGPGVMLTPAEAPDEVDPDLALMLAEGGALPEGDRISWAGKVTTDLESRETTGPDGAKDTDIVVERAFFEGQVELLQVETGDFVHCDELDVTMGETTKGDAYPAMVVAAGHVVARQEGSDIKTDRLTLEFAEGPPPDEPSDSVNPARFHATSMEAKGSVWLREGGKAEEDEPPTIVTAEELRADDLTTQSAVLRGRAGKPAKIVQGEDWLEGAEIHLNQAEKSIRVEGAGRMESQQPVKPEEGDPQATEPRLIEISWEKRMRFDNRSSQATVEGDVRLVSGEETISCGEMVATLEPEVKKTDEGETPSSKSGALGAGTATLGKRRLTRAECKKGVVVLSTVSTRQDEQELILRHMRLTGEELIYDPKDGRLNVPGAGMMFADNYEKPSRENAEWPTQTVFTWTRGMEYFQRPLATDQRVSTQPASAWGEAMKYFPDITDDVQGVVVLDGGVRMEHRSGRRIVQQERLLVPAFPAGQTGRQAGLTCDRLAACLYDAKSAGDASSAGLEKALAGNAGKLGRYKATGGVVLTDGSRRVTGEVLDHDTQRGFLIVAGDGRVPAEIIDPDVNGGRPVRSPRIKCELEDGKIVHFEAEDISVGP